MIRVEIYEVLLLCKGLLNLGEEKSEVAIRLTHTLQILLLVDSKTSKAHARRILVLGGKACREWQM